MIIHIAGSPGSGKSYLGDMIEKKYKDVKVVDTDVWRDQYFDTTKKTSAKGYSSFITEQIKKLNNKNVVLVGVLDDYIGGKDVFPTVKADVKLFLKMDMSVLYKQYNTRLLKYICKNKSELSKRITSGKSLESYKFKSEEELGNVYQTDYALYVTKHKYTPLTAKDVLLLCKKVFT